MEKYTTAGVVLSAFLALGSLWSAGTHILCKRFPNAWSCGGEPATPSTPPQSPAATAPFSGVVGHVVNQGRVTILPGVAGSGGGSASGDLHLGVNHASLPVHGGDLWVGGGVRPPRAPERVAPDRSVVLCLGDRGCPIRIERSGVYVNDRLTERGDRLLRWFVAWARGFPAFSHTLHGLGDRFVATPTGWYFASGTPGVGGGLPGSIRLIASDPREVLVIRPIGGDVGFVVGKDDHPSDHQVVKALYAWVGATVEVQGMSVRMPIRLDD